MTKNSPMKPSSYSVGDAQSTKKDSSFSKFLGLSKTKDKTLKQHSVNNSPTGQTAHSPTIASLNVSITTAISPSAIARSHKNVFTDDVFHPGIKTTVPHLQERIEKTEQLIYY
ncbi:hypothetical protein EC991_003246 [Linnemannia zychae]|nr:hypothetical protein EC991_003246 [Linnemannia zychae]